MLRWMPPAVAVLVAACSFQHGSLSGGSGDDDAGTTIDIDAPLADAMVDTPPGATCLGSMGSMLTVCYDPGMEPATAYTPTTNIDTNSDCDYTMNQGSFPNPSLCIKHGSSITIGTNIRATGLRPLVLVSMTTISVTATLDVSNNGAGANNLICGFGQNGGDENSSGSSAGGGGGGGGGWGTSGGAGGDGSVGGGSGGGTISLSAIRGGCPGGDGGRASGGGSSGGGGDGGGAVYLLAKDSIMVSGSIRANGQHGRGGGQKAGGGGGGSGGFIGFDAPSVTVQGTVIANGGGGGEGGDSNQSGNDGQDPVVASWDQRAGGGTGGADQGGDGGGGSMLLMTGAKGGTAGNAGGGGGGGAGRVRRFPAGMGLTGKISPPAP